MALSSMSSAHAGSPKSLGAAGMLKTGSAGAALSGRLERFYRMSLVLTFGGGCNEVQRDMIAMAGLGLPRSDSDGFYPVWRNSAPFVSSPKRC